MKKILGISSVTVLCGLLSTAYAAPCDNYQRDKATHFAEIKGREIVNNKYHGGKNIITHVKSCEYNSYSKEYKINVEIYWNGVISGDNYNSDGIMTMDDSGNISYNETYRNENLKDYAFNMGLAGGLLVLGALAATSSSDDSSSSSSSSLSSSSSSSGGGEILVHNKCPYDVKLLVRFKNSRTNDWHTGSWVYSAREKSSLGDRFGNGYRTNITRLTYAITNKSRNELPYLSDTTLDGYPAKTVIDKYGDTEITLCD